MSNSKSKRGITKYLYSFSSRVRYTSVQENTMDRGAEESQHCKHCECFKKAHNRYLECEDKCFNGCLKFVNGCSECRCCCKACNPCGRCCKNCLNFWFCSCLWCRCINCKTELETHISRCCGRMFVAASFLFFTVLVVNFICVYTIGQDGGDPYFYDLDTQYSANETRLFTVSSFFKQNVNISLEDIDPEANASLYIMKETPPLSNIYEVYSSNYSVPDDFAKTYYYLKQNSTITINGCVQSENCYYDVYIVKGPKEVEKDDFSLKPMKL